MNNKDFISKLAEAIRYTAEDAQTLADTLIDALKQQIDGEQQLVVSDFARFYVEKHYEYIAEDEKTGKRTLYPPKLLLCYETLYQVGDSQPQITAPEVAKAVAAQRNISQGEADMLLHQFFLSLLSAINTEKTVKVKGLGQFRLAPKKEKDYFIFTPDNALRDFINRHFAHFAPTPIAADIEFDDMPQGRMAVEKTAPEAPAAASAPMAATAPSAAFADGTSSSAPSAATTDSATLSTDGGSADSGTADATSDDTTDSTQATTRPWQRYAALAAAAVAVVLLAWFLLRPAADDKQTATTANEQTVTTAQPDSTQIAANAASQEEQQLLAQANEAVKYGGYQIVAVDTVLVMQYKQSLEMVAVNFFGSPQMVPYIKALNDGIDEVDVGTRLRIPRLAPK